MGIEMVYSAAEEIPAGFESLYTEVGGKYQLTGVNGIKTSDDVSRVQNALTKERNDHKAVKDILSSYKSLGELDYLQTQLARIEELEVAAKGNLDDSKINDIVEKRLTSKTAPMQREIQQLQSKLSEAMLLNEQFAKEKRNATIKEAVRAAANETKCHSTALSDIDLYAVNYFDINDANEVVVKDEFAGLAGLTPKLWLQEFQKTHPHWWPNSVGGGAQGSGRGGSFEANPWKSETWNMTQQALLYKADPKKAEQMAKLAGFTTAIGNVKPIQK